MRHELRMHLRPQERWTKQSRRSLTARAIVGSNTIEGYATSVDDVEALMAGETPLETGDATVREVESHRRAMTYVPALSDAGGEMCRLKWLMPQGQARGRHYVAGPAMRPVVESVRQSTSPYADPHRR
ncbi:hypothetical protein AB0K12_35650 [Nonomuraea sp. NPDC049419]|uniref:hypothetical protein n=1 Tax=Nonomuraea sp. NPDC049419 TaxID=3155772 RepID=UPI00341616E8